MALLIFIMMRMMVELHTGDQPEMNLTLTDFRGDVERGGLGLALHPGNVILIQRCYIIWCS